MDQKLYPLKFYPILKERIWGGTKLMEVLHKESAKKNIGESWELSDVEGDISIVANGSLEGRTLKELIETYKEALVGNKVFKDFDTKFPLLIKFIDAKEALSIQLHPDDALAQERHNSFGKTEMWYIMQADKGGNLIVGFKKDSNREEYVKHLKDKSLMEILNKDMVNQGDVYFIPAGRVHAIGAGVMLAEIQQTSDVTYRVYDWDRVDDKGNSRELHTELALDAIDYKAQKSYPSTYKKNLNNTSKIVDNKYFTTNIISIKGMVEKDHSDKDSFVIYIGVEGEVTMSFDNGITEKISKGETVLLPAALKKLHLKAETPSELLEVYVK